MSLNIFIGYVKYEEDKYFLNPKGGRFIDNHTKTFKDVEELNQYLIKKYKHRKATLASVSEEIPQKDKVKISRTLRSSKLNLSIILSEEAANVILSNNSKD